MHQVGSHCALYIAAGSCSPAEWHDKPQPVYFHGEVYHCVTLAVGVGLLAMDVRSCNSLVEVQQVQGQRKVAEVQWRASMAQGLHCTDSLSQIAGADV